MRHGWLLDRNAWHSARRTAKSQDWTKLPLNRTYSKHVPECPGVYMICVSGSPVEEESPFSALYEVAYVGKATGLRKRFNDHVRGYGDVVRVKEIFGRVDFWFTAAAVDRISEIESRLIDLLGPVANRVNGSTISGTIGKPRPVVGRRAEEN